MASSATSSGKPLPPAGSSHPPQGAVAFIHTGAWGDLFVSTAALSDVVERHKGAPVYIVGSRRWIDIIHPSVWPSVVGILVSDDGMKAELFAPVSRLPRGGSDDSAVSAAAQPSSTPQLVVLDMWRRSGNVSLRSFYTGFSHTYNIRTESMRYAWAPWLARVPFRAGSAPWPMDRLVYTSRAPWLGKDPLLHERDRMLQVIEGPHQLGTRAAHWRHRGLPSLGATKPEPRRRLWLVNPTASRREKAWPSRRFRELIAQLSAELAPGGRRLAVIGAPSETEWLRECLPASAPWPENIASASRSSSAGSSAVLDSAIEILQPSTIQDLLGALAQTEVLVTNTSSMQFLAPGAGVRAITLMGQARKEIWGPLGPADRVVQVSPEQRDEIAAMFDDIFIRDQKAYEAIPLEQVAAECRRVLAELS